MRKTFCDRCGEEIRELPDDCEAEFPKFPIYKIKKYTGETEMQSCMVAQKAVEVDFCSHCMKAFEDFMDGMKTVAESRTGGVFDDTEQE